MCGEGGCGCCAVSVLRKDPTIEKETTVSVNSVLWIFCLLTIKGWGLGWGRLVAHSQTLSRAAAYRLKIISGVLKPQV